MRRRGFLKTALVALAGGTLIPEPPITLKGVPVKWAPVLRDRNIIRELQRRRKAAYRDMRHQFEQQLFLGKT